MTEAFWSYLSAVTTFVRMSATGLASRFDLAHVIIKLFDITSHFSVFSRLWHFYLLLAFIFIGLAFSL